MLKAMINRVIAAGRYYLDEFKPREPVKMIERMIKITLLTDYKNNQIVPLSMK